ncbi:MAG: penicillin-binding protein activator LpoB [Verrucomicrobiae bacterium]|nr:penicillin-binding protein activator LpoB [Verrucomicrobiae bacterium]
MKPLLAPVTVAVLLLAGCSSPKATYVEADSSRLVTTVEGINLQDFAQAADAMTASLIDNLINPGLLKSGVPNEPALLAISRILNNTGQQFDTDLLIKKIRVALLRTGKVQTSTTIAFGGVEDPLVADLGGPPKRNPDYTLSGKIIEDRTKAGNVRQSSYIFQLSLSSLNGIAVWEDERTIVKQGSRATVGF